MSASSRAFAGDWPQWRGLARDGVSADVPQALPAMKLLWKKPLSAPAPAGIAVVGASAIVPDHDGDSDVIRCLSTADGHEIWNHRYEVKGELDQGNGPRATPLVHEGRVYSLGAFGELRCLDLASGKLIWRRNLVTDFGGPLPKWGYTASPLLAGTKLIVAPGAEKASVVALDPSGGQTLWQTPGKPAAFASFICATLGGVEQVVGYDVESLGGWELASGKRLWSIKPASDGDYNVSTPLVVEGKLLTSTDESLSRLFTFETGGVAAPKPVATNEDLAPDRTTPTALDSLVFGTSNSLACLDAAHGLKTLWTNDTDENFHGFSSLIAGNGRVLLLSEPGVLYLVAADPKECRVLGKQKVCKSTVSHPALAAGLLVVRDEDTVYCYDLR